jgi:hypothetical protein
VSISILGFGPCGFGLACYMALLSDFYKGKRWKAEAGKIFQKHERVMKVIFLLAIEILRKNISEARMGHEGDLPSRLISSRLISSVICSCLWFDLAVGNGWCQWYQHGFRWHMSAPVYIGSVLVTVQSLYHDCKDLVRCVVWWICTSIWTRKFSRLG